MSEANASKLTAKKNVIGRLLFWCCNLPIWIIMSIYGLSWWSDKGRGALNAYNISIYWFIALPAVAVMFSVYKAIRALQEYNNSNFDDLEDIPETVICTKCLEPFSWKDANDMKCIKCGGTLEDIKGFYERHPEPTK